MLNLPNLRGTRDTQEKIFAQFNNLEQVCPSAESFLRIGLLRQLLGFIRESPVTARKLPAKPLSLFWNAEKLLNCESQFVFSKKHSNIIF